METMFFNVALIIGLAAILALVFRLIKQPPMIAYLLTGIIAGPLALNLIGPESEIITVFAHIGVALLLFIVGLSLDFRVLKEVGKVSVLAGITEIMITGGIGLLLAWGVGFSNIGALYLGAALAFSSTVVVVKMLSDKKEIDTLHGRIALGILIVEDFVAALVLMVIPLLNGGTALNAVSQVGAILALLAGIALLSLLVLPKFLDYLAKNQEVLFLFGVGWALLVATIFDFLGFSLEIGALIAGISLAHTRYTMELGSKMKPLRDFFVVLFFVFFGSQLAVGITWSLFAVALLLSLFVVLGKPIIVMTALRIFGYKKRTNFLAGISLAQISEFSLIIVLLGYTLGHISQEIISVAVLIAIITIGLSSYSMYYSNVIFSKIGYFLNVFEGYHVSRMQKKKSYDVVVFGYHRMGSKIVETLKKMQMNFIVVDYNPKAIFDLNEQKIDCVYGDAADRNSLREMGLGKAKLVISTIPEYGANLAIQEVLKEKRASAPFIATAEQPRTAIDLYDHGVDYVIVPHHLGGDYMMKMLEQYGVSKVHYRGVGVKHLSQLKKRKKHAAWM